MPAIPYHLDAWDGYPAAREAVLEMARSLNKNLAVLAGALTQLVGPLQYCDTVRRGCLLPTAVATATVTECRTDWTYVDTVKPAAATRP